jgi:hypothetical protein
MSANAIARRTVLKQMFNKVRKWLHKARKWKQLADIRLHRVDYTSVPVWRPWRDY